MSTIPHEVTAVVDRIAAELTYGRQQAAREILDGQRKRWESEGRWQEQRILREQADREMKIAKKCNVWFETRDGFCVMGNVEAANGRFPSVWKRACHVKLSPFNNLNSAQIAATQIRTYELQTERLNGLPVYLET